MRKNPPSFRHYVKFRFAMRKNGGISVVCLSDETKKLTFADMNSDSFYI